VPYTDAAYDANRDQFPAWHLYREADVADTDPDTAATSTSACGERLLGTGHLVRVTEHAESVPDGHTVHGSRSLPEWLAHPSVCTECRMWAADEFEIEDEVRDYLRRRGQ